MKQNRYRNWLKKKILHSKAHQEKAFCEMPPLIIEKRQGRTLTLTNQSTILDFFSCSYLGLDLDPRVIKGATDHLMSCGVTFPAARTRAHVASFPLLEQLLSQIFGGANPVILSTLHLCHLGLLPLLGSGEMPSFPLKKNGPVFIIDRSAHSSLQINRALMEQAGECVVIDFEDIGEVEEAFKHANKIRKTPIAICDSIGSMGLLNPVHHLHKLAEHYQGYLYLDDAHGTSIFGKHGCGYVLDQFKGKLPARMIVTSSLAKAFGALAGVAILPTQEDANTVKRFAPVYVFGGPPALSVIDAAIASAKIHLSDEIYTLQEKLQNNIAYFDQCMREKTNIINFGSPFPIRGLLIGDEFKSIECALKLRALGFGVTSALYPTVVKGKSILRITLSSEHQKQDIQALCTHLNELMPLWAETENFLSMPTWYKPSEQSVFLI